MFQCKQVFGSWMLNHDVPRATVNTNEWLLCMLCTLIKNPNFCPKIQFWQNFTLKHNLNFYAKIFILKSIKKLNFRAKNLNRPKIRLKNYSKNPILINFPDENSKFCNFFWHFKFKIFCQIWFKKSNSLQCKFFLKLIFWTKNGVL